MSPSASRMRGPLPADPRCSQVESLFFGIGAQKAGTTWLHTYLSQHAEIRVPSVGVGSKELHYWDSIRSPFKTKYRDAVAKRQRQRAWRNRAVQLLGGRARRDRERQWSLYAAALQGDDPAHRTYLDLLFFGWSGQRAVGEISPAYALLDRDTLAEMAALSERSKFLFIMRDPLDRLLSGLRFSLLKNGQKPSSALLAEAAAQALDDDPELCLAKSRYEETIRRVESVVGPERVGYHFYESLFRQEELDRLTAFLGVAPRPGDVETRIHVGEGRDATLPKALLLRARAALDPTYCFIADRFGPRVPAEWDRSW